SRPCREPQVPPGREVSAANAAGGANKVESGHILVAKSDGSRQCEEKSGISLVEMEKQLKGIKVYSRSTQSDGLMRIQVCGASTGRLNVYEIDAANLAKAKSLGFKEWK